MGSSDTNCEVNKGEKKGMDTNCEVNKEEKKGMYSSNHVHHGNPIIISVVP